VATLERVQDLGAVESLMLRLPDLVGSPLSLNGLREDLLVSHKTVSTWLDVLERVYAVFRVAPFGAPRIRAIKKAQKHYHWDWSAVPEMGPRFENFVASHVLKWVHYRHDIEGVDLELRYFRDVDGREVDFVVTERKTPVLMVECKASDRDVALGLRYLKSKFPTCAAWQVSADGTRDYQTPEGIRVAPGHALLATLA
jgi:predicted AAA+ superfamily ATPase